MVVWVRVEGVHHVGHEVFHDNAPSPWLIVSAPLVQNSVPLVVGVPFTSKAHHQGSMPRARVLIPREDFTDYDGSTRLGSFEQLALAEQMRALSHERIDSVCALISASGFFKVEAAIKAVLQLP